ncbi:MAG: MFS transporter [Phycisphaerales bacterium]|nr:MFS transporter [Phycisphaerales bacterium]
MTTNQSMTPKTLPNTASWWNWGLAALYLMSCVFSVVSFAVLMPMIEKEAGLSKANLSAMTGLFFFAYSIAQLAAGLLIDRLGSRWLIGVTAVMATLGGLLFVSSDSAFVMYLGRSLMAIGLSSAFVGALYLASKWFPVSRFGLMSGVTNMSANIAGAVGSWAIAGLPYKPVILWWAIINVVIAALILLIVKNKTPQIEIDDEEETMGMIKGFAFLFSSWQVWLACIFFTGLFGTFLSYADFWNIQIQQAYGYPIETAALLNALLPIGLGFGSVCFGWFSDMIGKVAFPCRICAIASVFLLGLLIYTPYLPVIVVPLLLFLSGFFVGGSTLAFPAAIQYCPRSVQGTAIGLVTTCGYIGAGILNLIVPSILGNVPDFHTLPSAWLSYMNLDSDQIETVFSFRISMLPLMAAVILAIIASLFLRDVPKTQPSDG